MRWSAAAGLAAPVLFVGVFSIEGWLRPDYSATSMFVSELSIGPRGWRQIASFLLTGALLVIFAHGLRATLRGRPGGTTGPLLLLVIGFALFASGPFVTDPSALPDRHTVHGILHELVGSVFFAGAPVSCLVLSRRFRRDPAWHSLRAWALGAGIALVVEVGLLKVAQQPSLGLFDVKGLVQRTFLLTFMSWVFTLAAKLWSVTGHRREGRS